MSASEFSRAELAAAFEKFEKTVARAAATRDWDCWVQHYTPDVEYIEHAAGIMRGRQRVRAWIQETMTTFPGSHMVAFPSLWSVIDESTGELSANWTTPCSTPATAA